MSRKKIVGRFSIIITICLTMLFMVACGNNGGKNSTSPTPSASASSSDADNGKDSQEIQEINLFVDITSWPLADWKGKIPDEITKNTGIKVNVQVAADDKQLPLMIASGSNMPDIVYTPNHRQEMSDADVSYTWDELIKKYNVADFEIDPIARAVNTANDGNLYTILNGFMSPEQSKKCEKCLNNGQGLSVRADIMNELGNPKLESFDDYFDILKQVKQKHPELIPAVIAPFDFPAYFRVQEGAPRLGFYEAEDGTVKYYMSHPKQKDAYLLINELYREGYVLAENFTWKNQKDAPDRIQNGEAFSLFNATGDADNLNPQLEAAGKDFQIEQIIKPIGSDPKVFASGIGWSGMFVPKKGKNAETAIKFIQYMYSMEGQQLGLWGIEGEDWKWSDDKTYPIFNYDYNNTDIQKEYGVVWWGILADNGQTESLQRYNPDTANTKALTELKKVTVSNPLLGVIIPETDSQEQVIKANIDNMLKTELPKIYLAKTEAEAVKAYDDLMKKAKDIGLDKLNDWATKKYQEAQSRINLK